MSTPLHDLKRLVINRPAVSGRVVAIASGMVRVATAQGVLEVPGDGALQVNDRVTVQDGKAVKSQGQQNAPLHYV